MANFWKNPIVHGVAAALITAIPMLILNEPKFADLTVGGILTWLASYVSKNTSSSQS